MAAVGGGNLEFFCVSKKVFYANGMTTSEEEAQRCTGTIETLTGLDVELHHNGTTSSTTVTEIAVKCGLGAVGLAYAIGSDKKSKEKKFLDTIVGIVSIGLIGWGLADYAEIQKKKNASADTLAHKVVTHLQTDLLSHVVLVFHSQGADIGERALGKLVAFCDRIYVITIGGMVKIPDSFAARVVNFQNHEDLISKLANRVFGVYSDKRDSVMIKHEACETSFCHGADDYLSHPHVQVALQQFTSSTCYFYDPEEETAFPVIYKS